MSNMLRVKELIMEEDSNIGVVLPISLDEGEITYYKVVGFDTPYAILQLVSPEELKVIEERVNHVEEE